MTGRSLPQKWATAGAGDVRDYRKGGYAHSLMAAAWPPF